MAFKKFRINLNPHVDCIERLGATLIELMNANKNFCHPPKLYIDMSNGR
jgi:hypothetical protein